VIVRFSAKHLALIMQLGLQALHLLLKIGDMNRSRRVSTRSSLYTLYFLSSGFGVMVGGLR
jgi:hypothetical protein